MSKTSTLITYLLVLVNVLAVASCGGGDGGGGGGGTIAQDANMTGVWSFVASQTEPPVSTGCSGDLAGTPVWFCGYFVVPVQQNGDNFTGASASQYCGTVFSAAGTVAGTNVSGTFANTDGRFVYRTDFTGRVNGDTVTVTPTAFTIDGFNGSCSLRGRYTGTR